MLDSDILVVGSVGYDSVETPLSSGCDLLGGSATYFSIAASCFTSVVMVAIVGEDFKDEHLSLLRTNGIDISSLEISPGKTFRWSAEYSSEDFNTRRTLDTQLNVFANFRPSLDYDHRRPEYLFLANIDPELQLQVLGQMEKRPKLVAADTMNFWIEGKKEQLTQVIESVDVIFMDESEVRSFARDANLVNAARSIIKLGPDMVVAKRGEHGALLLANDSIFAAAALPVEQVQDPTGAGDAFAGGFMGYLAATNDTRVGAYRRATVMGSVMGSFAVEKLSVGGLTSLTFSSLMSRINSYVELVSFEDGIWQGNLPWREKDPMGSRDFTSERSM